MGWGAFWLREQVHRSHVLAVVGVIEWDLAEYIYRFRIDILSHRFRAAGGIILHLPAVSGPISFLLNSGLAAYLWPF